MSVAGCVLCRDEGGELLWADARCRVIRVTGDEGRDFPGFCRVIWQAHVAEMSDLAAADAAHLLHVVLAVERTLRDVMRPDKINLASLGNAVPHLHWHVIPRWHDDSHFPAPIWAAGCRPVPTRPQPQPPSATLAARLLLHLKQPYSGTSLP
ncbi:MAG: HIT family protein [Rugosibacter sp.]|nr:HIT family protein [Rugosibacter sp.]